MIQIVRQQMVYIAGSNLEVSCIYKNATISASSAASAKAKQPRLDEHIHRILEASRRENEPDLPEDTVIWLHNGKRFSHRNRRR